MILLKRDLKKLIESVLKEQDEDIEDILLDDEPVEQQENQEDQEDQEDQEEKKEKEDFKEVKFYLPRRLINKLVDNTDPVDDEEEIEIILKPDSGKLVYTIDGDHPPDLNPIKVMTVVGLGMIYGVDENGEKEKIANQLKDILVLDRSFANKTVGRMKEILFQKIKLGRLNFGKDKIRAAFNL